MEKELEAFRRKIKKDELDIIKRERRQQFWDGVKGYFLKLLLPDKEDECDENEEDTGERNLATADDDDRSRRFPKSDRNSWIIRLLKLLTWALVWKGFIALEAGAIYFGVSVLGFIYWNTRTGKKRRGEVSAYSVFNPECESIDGTLKPEHLEKQLLFRGA